MSCLVKSVRIYNICVFGMVQVFLVRGHMYMKVHKWLISNDVEGRKEAYNVCTIYNNIHKKWLFKFQLHLGNVDWCTPVIFGYCTWACYIICSALRYIKNYLSFQYRCLIVNVFRDITMQKEMAFLILLLDAFTIAIVMGRALMSA